MKTILLTALCTVFLLSSKAFSLETENIINGQRASNNQFPYMVSILECPKAECYHVCGGAFIAPNFVLTAAHCFYSENDPTKKFRHLPYAVIAGTTDIKNRKYINDVVQIHVPKRDMEDEIRTNIDIAVLKLATSFDISGKLPIRTISLPQKNLDFESLMKKDLILSGFGYHAENKNPVSIGKQNVGKTESKSGKKYYGKYKGAVESQYVGISDGFLRFMTAEAIVSGFCREELDTQFCVKDKSDQKRTFCVGDSGSPLVYNNQVIGVAASLKSQGCEPGSFNKYTKVSYFVDFINKAMSGQKGNDLETETINQKDFKYLNTDGNLKIMSSHGIYLPGPLNLN